MRSFQQEKLMCRRLGGRLQLPLPDADERGNELPRIFAETAERRDECNRHIACFSVVSAAVRFNPRLSVCAVQLTFRSSDASPVQLTFSSNSPSTTVMPSDAMTTTALPPPEM